MVRNKLNDIDGRYANLLRLVAGYGLPLFVVTLTLSVANTNVSEAYGYYVAEDGTGYDLCWLTEKTFIWAFMLPAALCIAFNTAVLVRCLQVSARKCCLTCLL